ncbi:MAG: hypothetical protein R3D45_02335 [Rhizobiaceae bacterium]
MDAIEKAIRNALEKGDAGDEAFRQRVYNSAFAALERALNARDTITPEAAEKRRIGLRAKIAEIESEFVPAGREPQAETPAPVPDVAAPAAPREVVESRAPDLVAEDRLSASDGPDEDDYDYEADPTLRRRPFAKLFVAALLLAAIGTGVWWTLQSGILLSLDERSGAVPNPPPELDGENFRPEDVPDGPEDGADQVRDWIGIFEPANSTEVTVPGGARADLVERDGESYLRISSAGGAEILFDIGEGTLERIAGGRALFSILARAEEGKPTQISIACDLAELGDCGRKRYEVGPTPGEFLFEIDLPDRNPGAAGTIAVNPDVSNSGLSLDIKEIRVAITR